MSEEVSSISISRLVDPQCNGASTILIQTIHTTTGEGIEKSLRKKCGRQTADLGDEIPTFWLGISFTNAGT